MTKKNQDKANNALAKAEKQLGKLLEQSEKDLDAVDVQLQEIYRQYNIDPELTIDPHIMAVIGAHINKTAELKIKSAGEKAKLAELLHKIILEARQIEIAEKLAKEHLQQRMDDNEKLWEEQPAKRENAPPDTVDEDPEYVQLVSEGEEEENVKRTN